MIGQTIIDSIDIFTNFGVGIVDTGYNGLVQFQSLKEPGINNWPETNGIEVDLSDPKLQNKTFIIKFYGNRDQSVRDFIDFLDEQVYHECVFNEIGITRTLRFTKLISRNTVGDIKEFELEFADDTYPFENYVRPSLIPVNYYCQNHVWIDNIPLSDYGFYHIDGLRDKLLVIGDVKEALKIDEISINSVIYDSGEQVLNDSRDVSLNLTIHAPIETFWNNWNAFYYDLTRPNERELYYSVRDESWRVFYRSCSVIRVDIINGEIWCYFTLNLTFSEMTINEMWNILATDTIYGDVKLDSTDLMVDTSIKPNKNPS